MNLLLIPASIAVTYFVYWLNIKCYNRWKLVILTPILISPIVLILLLNATNTSFPAYYKGAKWLGYMLGPATIAFAVPLYKQFDVVKKNFVEILCSLTIGSAVAIVSSFLYAVWMHLGSQLSNSLVPRSITTPVAMGISKVIGGIPTLTAVFIIITSVVGGLLGTFLIQLLRIKEPSAKGLMLGMSALGAGIAKAFEMGELEGTFASLAMITAAIISIILASTIFPLLQGDLLL
ncbi:LrgB family protein [Fictibacillus fluitans]|uniref:LrgB family protein n=1 Tax=Fictibacillus fluitans TaxID=3058422 RepID=A0ABT8HY74_9BACL|nr:LrgB family protein [Fictibacillus sp. NE201]MDN4525730.1 LrgB family protein [Fictibacillus sp. NE201]